MSTQRREAQARLHQSRLRLSVVLHQTHAAQSHPHAAGTSGAPPGWAELLNADPTARVLWQTVSAWWAQHPLEKAASTAVHAARELLGPTAQRNPLGLVLGAAVVGGALVLFKPWRWISAPRLAAGLVPQLLSKLIAQLGPLSWGELLKSWLQADDHRTPPG